MKKEAKSEVKIDKNVQHEEVQEVADEPKFRYIDCSMKEQEKNLKKTLKIIDTFIIMNNRRNPVDKFLTLVADEFRLERDEHWKPGKDVVNLQDRLSVLRFILIIL